MERSKRRIRGGCLAAALLLLLAGAPAGAQSTLRYNLGIYGSFTPDGCLIQTVTPSSPAAQAGLQPGDAILKINNQNIRNQQDFVNAVNNSGGTLQLVVRSGQTGQVGQLNVALAGNAQPAAGKRIHAPYMLGVTGQYTPQGMLVQQVGQDMPAARAGLQPGDLIVRINKKFIANQNDFVKVVDNSAGTLVLTVRKGQTGQVGDVRLHLRVYQLGVLGDFTPQGMVVGMVVPETPAARLGLQQGDVIASIDNNTIANQSDFSAALARSGGSVMLVVTRPSTGATGQMKADLMNNPLGAWCEPAQNGMRITSIAGGSPADRANLGRGDLILRVDGQRVLSLNDLTQALEQANGTSTLQVRDALTGQVNNLTVDLSK